jgi:hypothetical protein
MRAFLFALTRRIPFLAPCSLQPTKRSSSLTIGSRAARFSTASPFVPSAEQEAIISAVKSGQNVVVDAVAGRHDDALAIHKDSLPD